MDRAPVLHVGKDVVIGQSRSMERYVAKKCSLMGNTAEEEAIVDCISENVKEIKVNTFTLCFVVFAYICMVW